MKYTCVVFDFDGTIADTGEGIMKSAQYALRECGVSAPDDYSTMTYFIGPPLLVTFQEKFGVSAEQADVLVKKFRERYNDTGIYESKMYPGIKELLANLVKDGIKLGVASSKPHHYIVELLKRFDVYKYFDAVCGVSLGADCEAKSSIIARCLSELKADAKDALMVGDKNYDIAGAKANMMDSCGVLWGYGSKIEFINAGAALYADKPMDIEAIALGFFEQTEEFGAVYSGRIITVHNDTVSLPDGTLAQREIVDHPGGVAIAGITEDNQIIMVRQFRYAYKETVYEIPAGKLEHGEDPFEAGKREFSEECGAQAENYFPLGHIYPTPGYCSEKIYIYGATGLKFGSQHLDDGEFLDIIKIPAQQAVNMIMAGDITDAKTIIAILKLKTLGKI